MPGIADVATVGVPDNIYGEQIVVYVQATTDANVSTSDVIAHCGRHLAEFKQPHHVQFREKLPKTSRGKMDRKALLADWTATHITA